MAESNIDYQDIEPEQSTVDSELEETADEIIEESTEMPPTFDFKEKSWKTDFTLVVEGTKFYVAKNILALASPVFGRMFESDFKEKTSDELELAGKRAEDVNEFLLAVYPSAATVSNVSKEKALKVLPLAEEFQVLNLKQKCEDALLGSTDKVTKIDELYKLIVIAHRYDLKTLLAKCVSLVSEQSMEEIERENTNTVLPAEPLRDIFQNVLKRINKMELFDMQKEQELETCKTYAHFMERTLKRADVQVFGGDNEWVGKTVILTMDLIEKKPVTETVVIGGINLQIKLKFSYDQESQSEDIIAYITNVENNLDFNFKIQSVVLNNFPTEEHLSSLHEHEYSPNTHLIQCNVAQLARIENPKKGFVDEAKVQIELNIMMSRPEEDPCVLL